MESLIGLNDYEKIIELTLPQIDFYLKNIDDPETPTVINIIYLIRLLL